MVVKEYTSWDLPLSGVMDRYRVIVADDSDQLRRELAEILAKAYDVVALVEDGAQLLAAVAEFEPDLVVIDVSMPVLSGLDALQRLVTRGARARAVMVSTSGNAAYVRRALQLGAWGYVLKGSGVEDLPAALAAALQGTTFISPAIVLPD